MKKLILVLSSVAIVGVVYAPFDYFTGSQPLLVGKYQEPKKAVVKTPPAKNPQAQKPWYAAGSSSTPKAQDQVPANRRPNPYPIPKRIDLSHIEGKGIGYDVGYTKLAMIMGPEYRLGHHITLLDVEGIVFDDGKFAANAGLVGRFLSKSFCEIFGWSLFYDFRQGRHGNFNQISGGIEVLNKRWEVHVNAGVPIGKRTHSKTFIFDDYIGPFREVRQERESAAYTVDGKVGYYLVNGKNFQLYAAAGPYYLNGPNGISAVGGKAMLRPQYGDFVSVELTVSHDRLFETIYQINVVLSLPLYDLSSVLKHKKGPCGMSSRQVYQPVDPDIVLHKRCCSHNNF